MNAKDILIIGGGGHTRVLIGMAQALGLCVRGIVTNNASIVGTSILGVPVLALEAQFTFNAGEITLLNGVGNLANSAGSGLATRSAIYARHRANGMDFLPLVAAQAMVQPHVTLGSGAQVMAGAVIQPGCVIGENTIINTRASIDHDCTIAAHCHIAPGAVLCGHVVVGAHTHIGAGAIVTQGVRIGKHVVVGAGAVITRHIADDVMVRPALGEQSPLVIAPHA